MPFAHGLPHRFAFLARPIRSRKVVEQAEVSSFNAAGDPLLHYEQYGQPRADLPELNLRRAFLLQAWMDWSRPERDPPMNSVARFKLRAWIAGKYPDGMPYKAEPGWGFVDICDALGFDAQRTRKAIFASGPPSPIGIRRYANDQTRVTKLRRKPKRSQHVAH